MGAAWTGGRGKGRVSRFFHRSWLAAGAAALLLCPMGAAQAAQEVDCAASSAIVVEARNGTVLLAHNADEERPMASTTKIMTALLALEEGELTDTVTAGPHAFGVPGTSIYLSQGEQLTLEEMLYGLMLASGNDAAVAIAEHVGGTVADFCARMTERARELGCTHTVFLTPHGLPMEGHYTTARELAMIAREAMTHPTFRKIVSTARATIPWEGRSYDRILNNKNKLLANYPGATGIKTGYTRAAGRCLVSGAQREGMEIICVVLNCPDWFQVSAALMDDAFERYSWAPMLAQGEQVREMPVALSGGEILRVVAGEPLGGAVLKDSLPALEIELPDALEAPIARGQLLGTARMIGQDGAIAEVPLVAERAVARDDFPHRFRRCWQLWLTR